MYIYIFRIITRYCLMDKLQVHPQFIINEGHDMTNLDYNLIYLLVQYCSKNNTHTPSKLH